MACMPLEEAPGTWDASMLMQLCLAMGVPGAVDGADRIAHKLFLTDLPFRERTSGFFMRSDVSTEGFLSNTRLHRWSSYFEEKLTFSFLLCMCMNVCLGATGVFKTRAAEGTAV